MFGSSQKRLVDRESRLQELRKQRDEARSEREGLRATNRKLKETIKELEDRFACCTPASAEPGQPRTVVEESRCQLAARFLEGAGVEVGAGDRPLRVPAGVKVLYADRASRGEKLLKPTPAMAAGAGSNGVRVDLWMTSETLDLIPGETLDFVVANHQLQHCLDPIRVVKDFYRVLKWDGVMFLSLPDQRYASTASRRPASYEEMVQYHRATPASPAEHRPWEARLPHAWDQAGMLRFFNDLRTDFDLAYEVEAFQRNGAEGIFVLRKTLLDTVGDIA